MRYNLSSKIRLTRIPKRYYSPENAYEQSVLTRLERIPTDVYETVEEASIIVANNIAKAIKEKQAEGSEFVLGLSGGQSPDLVFSYLIKKHQTEGLSFKNVVVFLAYEFYPLNSEDNSNIARLKSEFFDHVDIKPENIHAPNGFMPKDSIFDFCSSYEQEIKRHGGIDLMLLGIGRNGNIGLNIPGSLENSSTRLVLLDNDSKKEAIGTFSSVDNVPTGAITMGIGTILKSKKIVLIAWGEDKAPILRKVIEDVATDANPASLLQYHENVKILLDLSAADSLTRIKHPWLVTNCEWDNKLIRRAVVWLCQLTGRPILKLTDKDYSEHGLGELLAIYGSAYNVNIKIFNDIQHTITGWPGGKPNADDSNRPERAVPYPKRIIVFSPHPDDDVISMGGTLRRLCDHNHDVHVAYQTSGNIAVGDEEVIRYVSYLHNVAVQYGEEKSKLMAAADDIKNFLLHEKKEGEPERLDVRFMKGTIRREEARTACRYAGVKPENVHFLDLPFYETGMVKKNPVSDVDKEIVKELIQSVKPHQIFVAGDLADPHGTHKVCLDVALAAIDELKNEEWFKECRIWMYRGAWAEWEMDHVEMAVPLSPGELRAKRNSILKHQSQMESAPFLGDDERLFWQRAEERNRQTAALYQQLGLASYEAIEAFVQYIPVE